MERLLALFPFWNRSRDLIRRRGGNGSAVVETVEKTIRSKLSPREDAPELGQSFSITPRMPTPTRVAVALTFSLVFPN